MGLNFIHLSYMRIHWVKFPYEVGEKMSGCCSFNNFHSLSVYEITQSEISIWGGRKKWVGVVPLIQQAQNWWRPFASFLMFILWSLQVIHKALTMWPNVDDDLCFSFSDVYSMIFAGNPQGADEGWPNVDDDLCFPFSDVYSVIFAGNPQGADEGWPGRRALRQRAQRRGRHWREEEELSAAETD